MSANDEFGAYVARIMASSLYANTSLTLFASGIVFFMAVYGLSVFLETPKDLRRGRARYIVIAFILFALDGLAAALDSFEIFKCLFEATSAIGYLDMVDQNMRSWQRYLSVVCVALSLAVGDFLLVYRCYVIWQHKWWVTVLPSLTCLASFAIGIVPLAVKKQGELSEYYYALTRICLTVSTNIMVTGLIAFHLLQARRSLSKVLPSADLKLYTGVVAILVESAAPLTASGIFYAATIAAYPRAASARSSVGPYAAALNISAFFFYCFCTLSPSMIIFRVTIGRSWVQFTRRGNGEISNPINFAHEATESSFLESSIGRPRVGNDDVVETSKKC